MTQSIVDPVLQQRRTQWIARVEALVAQIEGWSVAEGWSVERSPKLLRDKLLGEYETPKLKIRLPGGELRLEPIALYNGTGDGRVDLMGYPTLNRVKFIGEGTWEIMTDSNVPLRISWNQQTYAQLARDLLS